MNSESVKTISDDVLSNSDSPLDGPDNEKPPNLEHMDALKECYTAAFFWTRFFGKSAQHKKLLTELEHFLATLTAILIVKFVPTFWYPSNPKRGSGHRSLQYLGDTGRIDPMIQEAARLSGSFELVAHSPDQNLIMFINPGDVKVRSADSFQTVPLPLQEPPPDFMPRLANRIQVLNRLRKGDEAVDMLFSPASSTQSSRFSSRNEDDCPPQPPPTSSDTSSANNAITPLVRSLAAPVFQPSTSWS